MASRKQKNNGASLPFAALQLLAPPVRLVSAALWKVMKQRDAMQYGVVEEFVTSACETVPGLLTLRHQSKLALGLRGRYILELCSSNPDEKVILPQLEKMCAPAAVSASSAPTARDVKITRTVKSFQLLVHTLLSDPAEREHFFTEEFPVDYGPKFDQEIEKLLWEFLIRLDQLLPVPNLAQTVSWLSEAPPVLEECARAATQPQLLKILLQHQTCLGHLEAAASLPPNMGDSILDSLSLPPSGRVPLNQPTGAALAPPEESADKTSFITPVFGLISDEDVPAMISANKRTHGSDGLDTNKQNRFTVVMQRRKPKDDAEEDEREPNASKRSSGLKRKQPDRGGSDSVEEDDVSLTRSGRRRISASLTDGARREHRTKKSQEDGAKTQDLDIKTLHLPEDPTLCSAYASCMRFQPRVVVVKMDHLPTKDGDASDVKEAAKRRKSPTKAPTRQKPDSDRPGLDDKENHPVLPSISSSPQLRRNTETPAVSGDTEDYVADSEDEATKNFKGRLFMKRYYKTKHGTYIPTLREYWKPGMTQRHLCAAPSKHR